MGHQAQNVFELVLPLCHLTWALNMILLFYCRRPVAVSLKQSPVPPTWLPRNWLFNYAQALEKAPFAVTFNPLILASNPYTSRGTLHLNPIAYAFKLSLQILAKRSFTI